MRKKIMLLIVISWVLTASVVCALPSINITHTFQSQDVSTDTSTLFFSLHVDNTGNDAIQGLNLTYAPLSILAVNDVTLSVGDLSAGAGVDVPFQLVVPASLDSAEIESMLKMHLSWACESIDSNQSLVEFPAISKGAEL